MKIPADHCVYGKTVRILKEHGYEVLTLKELNKTDATDDEVLRSAVALDAVLLTNDKGFGNVFQYPPASHRGIILMKINLRNDISVHEILLDFLRKHEQQQLRGTLAVIDGKSCRTRR